MLQGLFRLSFFRQFIHTSLDISWDALLQLHRHPYDDFMFIVKATMAIGKLQFFATIVVQVPLHIYRIHTGYDLIHFSIIGTCIHKYSATQTTRNANSKFQATYTFTLGIFGHFFQSIPSAHSNSCTIAVLLLLQFFQAKNDTTHTPILDEHIRPQT